jgi:hypothetical protein
MSSSLERMCQQAKPPPGLVTAADPVDDLVTPSMMA